MLLLDSALGLRFSGAAGQAVLTPHDRQILLVGYVAAYLGYHAILLAYWHGQTVGKRLLGVRVVTEAGAPLSFARAVWREPGMRGFFLGGYIGLLSPGTASIGLVLLLADVISPLLQEERRAIHDLLAGTRVILADRPPPAGVA